MTVCNPNIFEAIKIISIFMQRKLSLSLQLGQKIRFTLIFALLITSCGESKVSQCNQLIAMVNSTEQTISNITQASSPDISALQDIATATNQAVTDLEMVNLSNNKLNSFKSRFLEFYTDISTHVQTIVTAHNEQNMSDAKPAYTQLETTFEKQQPLVDELNNFCRQGYDE
ncbi:MAG: hypothetical protein AAGD25_03620 [Cyanobacteria bacterium P01_F01_bin.150]